MDSPETLPAVPASSPAPAPAKKADHVPGLDEVLALLALGLARALEARQPSAPPEGKSPPLQ
jgi:hypothetical protein